VALLRRLRFTFRGGERLRKFGDDLGARREICLLKPCRVERATLALDSGIFRLKAREAAPFLAGSVNQRTPTGAEI
jgi:hypothetical protein